MRGCTFYQADSFFEDGWWVVEVRGLRRFTGGFTPVTQARTRWGARRQARILAAAVSSTRVRNVSVEVSFLAREAS
jgi:hypothetical protein